MIIIHDNNILLALCETLFEFVLGLLNRSRGWSQVIIFVAVFDGDLSTLDFDS